MGSNFRISKIIIVQLCSLVMIIVLQSCTYSYSVYKADKSFYKVRREFKNNYFNERHLHRKFFRNNPKDQHLSRYMDSVSVIKANEENIISYQSQNIIIPKEQEQYLSLFKTGLIHPRLFADTYSSDTNEYFVMVKEIFYTPQKVTRKRFELQCWPAQVLFNPSIYIFEIRNNDADKKTNFETFVNGAHLSKWKFFTIRL